MCNENGSRRPDPCPFRPHRRPAREPPTPRRLGPTKGPTLAQGEAVAVAHPFGEEVAAAVVASALARLLLDVAIPAGVGALRSWLRNRR